MKLICLLLAASMIACTSEPVKPKFHPKDVLENTTQKLSPMVRLTSDGKFFCSGTVISRAYVLTAGHCAIQQHIIVQAGDKSYKTEGEFVAAGGRIDLALVKGDFSAFNVEKVLTGLPQWVAAISASERRGWSCGFAEGGHGACQEIMFNEMENFSVVTNAVPVPGNSGGPVIVSTGEIVGVNSYASQRGLAFATTIELFAALGVEVEE